ncbi:alpha/beta hydrolase [Roseateles sp. P5_E1]
MSRRLCLLLSFACLLSACGGGGSSSDATPAVTPPPVVITPNYVYVGTLERDKSITSRITGINYPYHVYLPENYAASGKAYPVMYATDGQWSFNAFSQLLDKRRKPMILVNIEQGPGDRRAIDYTVNGAPAYARFLKEELAPLIEANYRTTGVRSFSGTSYGGLLGSILLSTEAAGTPFFRNYLLFDGAFWALTARNIQDEQARFTASPRLPVHLILTSANAPGNVNDVIAYEARYKGRAYMDLLIQRKDFNIAHNDVGDPSFDWAIDLID